LLLLFFLVGGIYFIAGLGSFTIITLLRDASILFYIGFFLSLFLFHSSWKIFLSKLITLYAWYPVIAFISYQLSAHVEEYREFILFGDTPFALVKFGDMAVHLLVTSLLIAAGLIRYRFSLLIINLFLILYLILVIASYTRGGLLAYSLPLIIYLYQSRHKFSEWFTKSRVLIMGFVVALSVVIYLNSRGDENFQGRALGFEQVSKNVLSLFSEQEDGALTDNKLWRLAWWYKIVTDAFELKKGLIGVGVGPNLTLLGDIGTDDEQLRSPHSIHLTILARFGIPLFLLWLYWVYLQFRRINSKEESDFSKIILFILLGFIINASFDVYLEGPMGAFPFWTWVGILYCTDYFNSLNAQRKVNA
jgi:Ca2+/Na+ antiporter